MYTTFHRENVYCGSHPSLSTAAREVKGVCVLVNIVCKPDARNVTSLSCDISPRTQFKVAPPIPQKYKRTFHLLLHILGGAANNPCLVNMPPHKLSGAKGPYCMRRLERQNNK